MPEILIPDRKAQIKQVAQNLFREKGYAATGMRDLARALGIEAASIYSHVDSKEAILREICFRMADEFFAALSPVLASNDGPKEQLRKAIQGHVGVIWRNYDAAAVFLHEWRFLVGENLAAFKAMRRDYEQQFRSIIEAGMAVGAFRPVDLKVVLPTLFSSMNWTFEYVRPDAGQEPDAVGQEIFELFFGGIKEVF